MKHLKRGEYTEDVTKMMPFVRSTVVTQLGQNKIEEKKKFKITQDDSVSSDSDDDCIIIIKK